MSRQWKFLIVGAGPSGSSAAIHLRAGGHSVVLVERSHFQEQRVGELLSPEGKEAVKQVLSSRYHEFFLKDIGIVGAWDTEELQRYSEPTWCTLDRRGLDSAIAQEAERVGAELHLGSRIQKLARLPPGWSYSLAGEERFADWVVVANGRNSPLARTLGGRLKRFDRQVALVGFLEGEYCASQDMLIEATPSGWWYAAPVDTRTAVAIFITDNDLDRGDPHQAWLRYLSESTHAKARFGGLRLTQKPYRVAAGCTSLSPFYGSGWVTVGESAVSFDPLSSMGVGRACETGALLGKLFLEAGRSGDEPELLSYYEMIGSEFHIHRQSLLQQYNAVDRYPDSVFWNRRTAGRKSLRISTNPKSTLESKGQASTFLPAHCMATWGRTIGWSEYKTMEDFLLGSESIIQGVRSLCWSVVKWLHAPQAGDSTAGCTGLREDVPESCKSPLEHRMALHLLAESESATPEARQSLFQNLLDEDWVRLGRIGWQGQIGRTVGNFEVDKIPWLLPEIERFLVALVERKYLLCQTPIFYNLVVLAALPRLVVYYSVLSASLRNSNALERQDLTCGLNTAELCVSSQDYGPLASKQAFFCWYVELYNWEQQGHEKQASGTLDPRHQKVIPDQILRLTFPAAKPGQAQ